MKYARQGERLISTDPMRQLAAGIPLSLLLDLVWLDAAGSREISRRERADTSWVTSAA